MNVLENICDIVIKISKVGFWERVISLAIVYLIFYLIFSYFKEDDTDFREILLSPLELPEEEKEYIFNLIGDVPLWTRKEGNYVERDASKVINTVWHELPGDEQEIEFTLPTASDIVTEANLQSLDVENGTIYKFIVINQSGKLINFTRDHISVTLIDFPENPESFSWVYIEVEIKISESTTEVEYTYSGSGQ